MSYYNPIQNKKLSDVYFQEFEIDLNYITHTTILNSN